MIFRIVLFENAFESFPIGLIPIYLPQKCMVQSRLMYLTGFITHAQVFHMASHQLTYSHMLDELYTIIFSVLSAKKSWFHSKSAMPLERVTEQTYKDCRFVSSMTIVFVSYFCKYFTISTFKKNEFFVKMCKKAL